jgi:type II secretory pathway component GspD/PulD (secretin)
MKKKLTVLLLGLATSGLVSFGQDNNVPDSPAKDTAPPPDNVNLAETTPAAPANAPADKPAPGAPAAQPDQASLAAPKSDEIVPLIVIDDVPLTDAVRNLARQSGLNFQFDPRIGATNQPSVSIRFENVSAQEALLAVLENYNLKLDKDPKAKIARITIKDPKAEEPLISKIVQLRYSDPTNMVHVLKATLPPRSSIVADARTSQIIVTTTEKEMDNALTLIEKLDTATRQVLIEAKLFETAKNPSTVKGIDWSGTLEAQRFTLGNNTLSPPSSISDNKLVPNAAPRILLDTAKGFNPATAFLDADGLSAVLSFLNKDNDTEVVATPRAVTLDNQVATLSVTRAFPIFQVTPGSANSPAGATVTYTNLGAILYVTPRIAADNNIALRVAPEVSNIDGVDRQTLNSQVNTANIYAIRRIETSVMIPSGNTLVMGGLVNNTKNKSYIKVPVLGDLPGIGLAFRKESKSQNKQNLLIFITPTIVENGDYQPNATGRDFLSSRSYESPDEPWSSWDSGKPHDWTKPVY